MTADLPHYLTGDVHQHASQPGVHLLDRLMPLTAWSNARLAHEVESYSKVTLGLIGLRARGTDRALRQWVDYFAHTSLDKARLRKTVFSR